MHHKRDVWEMVIIAAIASGRKNVQEAVLMADDVLDALAQRFPEDKDREFRG